MAKRNETDPLVGKSFRLPKSQVKFIKLLRVQKIFPGNESDVLRLLLERAIQELIATEYVKKRIDTMKLLNRTSAS